MCGWVTEETIRREKKKKTLLTLAGECFADIFADLEQSVERNERVVEFVQFGFDLQKKAPDCKICLVYLQKREFPGWEVKRRHNRGEKRNRDEQGVGGEIGRRSK